jgi:hypothetical protein
MRLLSLAHFTVIDADPVTLIDAGVAGASSSRHGPPCPGHPSRHVLE